MSIHLQPLNLKSHSHWDLKNRCFILFCLCFFGFFSSYSQTGKSACAGFRQLSRAEKCWVMLHPFIAKKTWKISLRTKEIVNEIKNDSLLDGDAAGGQVDAFRHALWMASLCREISWRKAYRLGKAHERGNYAEFKNGKTEDGFLPDKASTEMDLFNNNYGILTGRRLKKIPEEELIVLLKNSILGGELKIIKKDSVGNSLNEEGEIIPENEWNGKWENKRALVRSDFNMKLKR